MLPVGDGLDGSFNFSLWLSGRPRWTVQRASAVGVFNASTTPASAGTHSRCFWSWRTQGTSSLLRREPRRRALSSRKPSCGSHECGPSALCTTCHASGVSRAGTRL